MDQRLFSQTSLQGNTAEMLAEKFLTQQGLRTLCKNYRCKLGEIDLIMMQGDTLVFVEVRLRSNSRFSSAAESVTGRKQQKIIRAAQVYLQQTQLTEQISCRFDVVALTRNEANAIPEWIPNAFDC
jgi:putative endonuclease